MHYTRGKTQCLGQSHDFFFPKSPRNPLLFLEKEPFLFFFPKRSFVVETVTFAVGLAAMLSKPLTLTLNKVIKTSIFFMITGFL